MQRSISELGISIDAALRVAEGIDDKKKRSSVLRDIASELAEVALQSKLIKLAEKYEQRGEIEKTIEKYREAGMYEKVEELLRVYNTIRSYSSRNFRD